MHTHELMKCKYLEYFVLWVQGPSVNVRRSNFWIFRSHAPLESSLHLHSALKYFANVLLVLIFWRYAHRTWNCLIGSTHLLPPAQHIQKRSSAALCKSYRSTWQCNKWVSSAASFDNWDRSSATENGLWTPCALMSPECSYFPLHFQSESVWSLT